ncbi:MAG: histidine kinase [Bacteroidota bacterium]|nr:histidine kinase [Bacteroidota bacterium]
MRKWNHIKGSIGLIAFCLFALLHPTAFSQSQLNQQNSINQQNTTPQKQSFQFQKNGMLDMYLDSARYLSSRLPMRAVEFINKAIEESIKTNNREKGALAYLILGDIQQHLSQHDLAIENYKKTIKELSNPKKLSSFGNTNQTTLFNSYKHAAVSYIELSKLDEALLYITNSIDKSTSGIPAKDISGAKRVLATIYTKQGKLQESKELLIEVLLQEQSSKNTQGEIQTLLALGKTYQAQNDENTAIEYYTKARELSEKTKQSNYTLEANEQLASVYRKQKKLDKEVATRNSNIAINNSTNNFQANTFQNIEIGNAYLNDNQIDKAVSFYDMGFQQVTGTSTSISTGVSATTFNWTNPQQAQPQLSFSTSADLDETSKAYRTLAKEYVKRKEFDKATIYFEKYARIQDSIKQIRAKELEEAIAISTTIGKNQQRVDLLEKERELNAKSIDILKQDKALKEDQLGLKNIIIISLCIAIALMLLAVFFIIRSSREKRKVHQLLALKSLRGQMNPHFIFNALNSVNHYVSQNDERQANRYLSDFSRLMRLVMDSSKFDFISISDELEMLRLYLQLEHARFEEKFDYEIEVGEQIEKGEWEIPPMLIQPYLENAVWHGLRYIEGKGALKMNLSLKDSDLLVTITDTGIGRTKSQEIKTQNQKKQTSLGMQNIESRIDIMNQVFHTNIKVEIRDAFPGQKYCGTQVKLLIPQKKNVHA